MRFARLPNTRPFFARFSSQGSSLGRRTTFFKGVCVHMSGVRVTAMRGMDAWCSASPPFLNAVNNSVSGATTQSGAKRST